MNPERIIPGQTIVWPDRKRKNVDAGYGSENEYYLLAELLFSL